MMHDLETARQHSHRAAGWAQAPNRPGLALHKSAVFSGFAGAAAEPGPAQSSASSASSVTGPTADTGSGGWPSTVSGRARSALA